MHQRDRGNRHTWSLAGSHHLRFKFVCVSAPFAATQGGILVNSVHLSTYSLSGHDAPKAAASIQDAITGCLHWKRAASRFRIGFGASKGEAARDGHRLSRMRLGSMIQIIRDRPGEILPTIG